MSVKNPEDILTRHQIASLARFSLPSLGNFYEKQIQPMILGI